MMVSTNGRLLYTNTIRQNWTIRAIRGPTLKTSVVMLTTLSLQDSEHGLVLWAVIGSSQCSGLECLLKHVILNNEYSFVILRGFFCNSFLFAANI